MTAEARSRSRSRSAIAWVCIVVGLAVFPVLWSAVVVGRFVEVEPLMRFLARSDAHVFFDLPGVLAELRAYAILFTAMPATGATLVAFGVMLLRDRRIGQSFVVAVGVGAAVLMLVWLTTPWLATP